MPEYAFIDGLLEGNVSSWPELASAGETFTIQVIDVGQHESDATEADYRVTRMPEGAVPGHLQFVAARGRWSTAQYGPAVGT
jgi:hypothetical protein